ncbi:MAG: LapA family protein [Candidatus Bathyarchaeia archaeon]
MGENKKSSHSSLIIVLAVIAIVALIGLTSSLIIYSKQNSTLQDKNKQISDLQSQLSAPKLVSIGLQYNDNRSDPNSPFLHITGYIVNVGSATAKNCAIHVTAGQNGNATPLNMSTTIAASLDAGIYQIIDVQLPYTGPSLTTYTSYLAWTN